MKPNKPTLKSAAAAFKSASAHLHEINLRIAKLEGELSALKYEQQEAHSHFNDTQRKLLDAAR
jgi:predicted  nucleic acid-binding Zn-ribbon protein